jgi:hypothetical protein
VNRLTNPSREGVKIIFGGYVIESGTLLKAVITINSNGMMVINTYPIIKVAAIFRLRDEASSGDLEVSTDARTAIFLLCDEASGEDLEVSTVDSIDSSIYLFLLYSI